MPRRKLFVGAMVSCTLVLGATRVWAGDITGQVTDSTFGRALPNATVSIPGLGITVTADRGGRFRIDDVPAGTHELTVEFIGFERGTASVTVGETGVVLANLALADSALEEVAVTGFRLAQATALQAKRSADNIVDTVTANDAGKLPDRNAAETLVRVPGVSVTIDQGEGRYVTIRGIDAALNSVTIDGQIIGSPEGDTRRVALDTVPADLLSRLEVVKTITPDLDGNAIGGSINLVTPSAFDNAEGRFLSATAEYGYYDLNSGNPYAGAIAWGQTFGPEKQFGVVLSASYSNREFRSENLQGGAPWVEEGDFLVPDEFVLRDYEITRTRTGFVANLEYLPNDRTKLYWRNLYNDYEDVELQSEVIYDYRNGDLENQTPTSGTFTEGEAQRAVTRRKEIQSILSSTLGGEFQFGDWTLGVSATYGEVEQDTPFDNGFVFELDDEIPMHYDTSRTLWRVDAGPEASDPGLFEFDEAAIGGQLIKEDIKVARFDLERAFRAGDRSGSIKFGAKYIDREQTSDQDMTVYDGFDGPDIMMSQFTLPGRRFSSAAGGYDFGPRVDYFRMYDFFRANASLFEADDEDTVAESFGVDYKVGEQVTAGYIMGTLRTGRATWIAGVRAERTKNDFLAYNLEFVDGDIDVPPPQVTGSKSYTNWLPSLHLTYTLREDLLLRAAWTNTIGRPSYEQNVPFRIFEIEEDDPGIWEGSLEAGNPDLDPLESMNFDVAIEWYLRPAGILSAAVFHKDIDNPIFTRVMQLENVTFEGRFFSELEIEQAQNARSGRITGIELNYQQQFRNLPSPFDGFGVALGYTWTDSEATVFDRADKVPFFLQSDHILSAALYWEKHGFEARLGYSYRSAYLDEVGESPDSDIYVDRYGRLDLKASYQVTPNASVFFQAQNITGEPLRMFSGDRSRVAENEYYSWNAMMGVSLKF